jgi:hypothetical protein
MTQVFLLAGTTSFPDPGNWNPVNTVEVIGAGCDGRRSRTSPPCPVYVPGPGSPGGGYGRGSNRMEAFPVALLIVPHSQAVTGGTAYYSNWANPSGGTQNPSTGNTLPGAVYAGNAGLATAFTGGYAGAAGGPDVGYAGGVGGNYSATTSHYGGGGGGAAGPHGAGSNGANAGAAISAGGASDGGTVAGATTAGGAGRSGTQWDASHGTGSGGAGGNGALAGGVGGRYGGGAGGCGNTNTTNPAGGDGLIILTYTPYTAPPQTARAIIMA